MTMKSKLQTIKQVMNDTNSCTDLLRAGYIHRFITDMCNHNSDYNYVGAYDDILALVGTHDLSYQIQRDCVISHYELKADLSIVYNCWSTDSEVDNDYCRFVDYELTLNKAIDRQQIELMNDAVINETLEYHQSLYDDVA